MIMAKVIKKRKHQEKRRDGTDVVRSGAATAGNANEELTIKKI